jgi:hypothetical protein
MIIVVLLGIIILAVLAAIGVMAWLDEKEIQNHYADETFLNDGGKHG